MKAAIIALTTAGIFNVCCDNANEKSINTQTETVAQNNQTPKLNKGKKWKVDDNMMIYIRSMEKDVKEFSGKEMSAYKSLSEKLQSNISLLTSNCTMKGKAHDELHKWLLPYIGMVNNLSKADNKTEAAQQYQNIQKSFSTFNMYFQ